MKRVFLVIMFVVVAAAWCQVSVIDSDPDNYCTAYSNSNAVFAYGNSDQKVILKNTETLV